MRQPLLTTFHNSEFNFARTKTRRSIIAIFALHYFRSGQPQQDPLRWVLSFYPFVYQSLFYMQEQFQFHTISHSVLFLVKVLHT